MKFCLLAFVVLAMSTALWAQCSDQVSYLDGSCSEDANCPPSNLADCTSNTFTAACTGQYVIEAWTYCTGTNCAHCNSCVLIYQGAIRIGSARSPCEGGTSADCCGTGTVSLTANTQYTIYVCLSRCSTDLTCSPGCGEQGSGCTAGGCVRYGTTPTLCYTCQ